MERIKRRDERRIGIDPDEVSHPAFWNQLCDLIGGVAVWVYEKTTVALPDVFDEKVDEQGRFSHARHPLDINVLC